MTKNDKSLNEIKLEDIKKVELREKVIYIRTTEKISKWMKENKISPSSLFNRAAEVVMEQHGPPKPNK